MHPPRGPWPGEGRLRERPALQGHRGNGGRKTPASKHSQGSSTDPDSGSPRAPTPTRQRQRDRVSELTSVTCDWLYHLVWPQPHFTLLLCSSVVPERWKLLIFPPFCMPGPRLVAVWSHHCKYFFLPAILLHVTGMCNMKHRRFQRTGSLFLN